MKILIINPNSSVDMTHDIDTKAQAYGDQQIEVHTVSTPEAPEYVDTYEDAAAACPGMMRILRENKDEYDAFIVACHCDPNLDVLKEMTEKPVVGIGEASMKLATMLGHRFSVISVGSRAMPIKEELIRSYGLEKYAGKIQTSGKTLTGCDDKEAFLAAAKRAVEEDNAEVIVLGCAGLCGLDDFLAKETGVPVLDGVSCALAVASGLVRMRTGISKACRYAQNVG